MNLQPADLASSTIERPRIEAFEMHPLDYALMQQAAALSDLPEADFVQLAVYLHSRDLVAQWGETGTLLLHNRTEHYQGD